MTDSKNVPVFPLQAALFPTAAMALQIFEPRYVDMIAKCMREDKGFVIVQLLQGTEVFSPQTPTATELGSVGTYARIQDFSSLPNGHLGIVVRGAQRVVVGARREQKDHLLLADVEFLEPEPALALAEEYRELLALLQDLLRHPSIESLNHVPDFTDAVSVSNNLAQLLPFDPFEKYELLLMPRAEDRLECLAEIIERLRT